MLPISERCSYQQLFYENLREIDSSCEFFWVIVLFQNKTERRNLRMKSYPIKVFFFKNTLNINLLSSHLLCLVQFWKYKMWDERKHKSNSTRTELDLQNHTISLTWYYILQLNNDKLVSIGTRLFMKESNGMACEKSIRRLVFLPFTHMISCR